MAGLGGIEQDPFAAGEDVGPVLGEDADHLVLEVDLLERAGDQFRDPHAGGVEQLEHCLVPQLQRVVHQGRLQQRLHLGFAQIRWQLFGELWPLQQHGGIVAAQLLAIEVLVEAAQGREETGRAAGRELMVHPPGEVVLDVVQPRQQQGTALLIEPEGKFFQVGAIGADRVVGEPPLQPEGVEKRLDQGMGFCFAHGAPRSGKQVAIVTCRPTRAARQGCTSPQAVKSPAQSARLAPSPRAPLCRSRPLPTAIKRRAMKIGLFYGSTTCYTEMAAEKIRALIGPELVDLHNIKDVPLARMQEYDILILGISTWDFGELQEDWESRWEDIADLHLEGRIIALFGMGDQLGYGEWYQDALGLLHDQLVPKGVKLVGYWPNEGYEFDASKALIDDGRHFVGLALDDANQYDQTESRIEQWVDQILSEIHELL